MELTTRRTGIGGRGAPLQNGIRFESYRCNNRSNSPTDYNSNTKLLPCSSIQVITRINKLLELIEWTKFLLHTSQSLMKTTTTKLLIDLLRWFFFWISNLLRLLPESRRFEIIGWTKFLLQIFGQQKTDLPFSFIVKLNIQLINSIFLLDLNVKT